VPGQHVHLQARTLPGPTPRDWIGQAKRQATFVLKDRAHQENVFHYILSHAEEGAWVWHFRMAPPQSPPAAGGL
jgi:hypothetical protein